jgi:hypothetical protein
MRGTAPGASFIRFMSASRDPQKNDPMAGAGSPANRFPRAAQRGEIRIPPGAPAQRNPAPGSSTLTDHGATRRQGLT